MSEYIRSYIDKRVDEEGLDVSDFNKEDLNYREGGEKLHFEYQFFSGEIFKATENNGEAKIVILRDGQEVFNFKEELPSGVKLVTPEYWLRLDRRDKDAPSGFKRDPEGFRNEVAGQWQCGEGFISVGKMVSLKDIFALLHEIGHSNKIIFEPKSAQDKREAAELLSGSERSAWVEALRTAKKISSKLRIDLFEGFSDKDDLKRYIYTCLSSHRYLTELKSAGTFRLVLDFLEIKPINTDIKWLDKLFDKRKLFKK